MIRKTAIISLTLVMVMIFSSYGVLADEFGSLSVNTDNAYIDSDPCVWNTYIVWTRGLDNLVVDDYIDWNEPSWIMVHEITSGETWNLTPDFNTGQVRSGNYYHASTPDIYGNKIIYTTVYGTASHLKQLNMYNITRNESWVNIPIPELSGQISGDNQEIYGDWIFATRQAGSVKVGLIYKYNTQSPDYFIPMDTGFKPNTQLGAVGIFDNYVVWTEKKTISPYESNTVIFNLDNYKCIKLNLEDKIGNPIKNTFSSVYGDTLIFGIYDTLPSLNWNLYGFDLSSLVWFGDNGIIGNINSPQVFTWFDIENRTFEVNIDDSIDTAYSSIWINMVYYRENNVIYKYDINKNRTVAILDIPYDTTLPDVHFDKVVWTDNRAGEFNVYRLTTNIEAFSTIMILSIPVIMIGVVVVLFWKAFSGGLGGMS